MAPDEDAVLAEPLERFAALHASTLRRSRRGVIDLSYPNSRIHRDSRAFDVLASLLGRLSQNELQYTPFGGGTIARRRTAFDLSRRLGLDFGFRDIALTPGATAALRTAFQVLFCPGEEVLVVTPCWMDYILYLRKLGLTPVLVPAGPDKRLDPDAVAAAVGPDTAGLVISQPACPTGVVYTATELMALTDALRARAVRFGRHPVLVSDEVHRDQVWGDTPFTSPMQMYPETVSVYSFGKAWSLQGQRTGYLALSPALRHREKVSVQVERALRSTGFGAPTAIMQRLVVELAGLTPDCQALRDDQIRLRSALTEIGYQVVPGAATTFLYARCPDGYDDWGFVQRLASLGVLAMPSTVFHEVGYFRLALNVASECFEDLRRRLSEALAPGSGPRMSHSS